ncbi:hydroxymethylbilane synthase [Urechidicola vernalis]|uniref:Hydroxymethylbilane synthase n=1 Tax=Urechidicola vernalis TaxID=3075600 RepID=A0ABU2Y506_9FLAO|nr:hydroxymethylbilane synthase [Urechidicola sp. P050]MDT0552355.1 hydroxymethylbilane synthase [Urechidicola sp. P050]
MEKIIRIGTRSSELALWQANTVAHQLNHLGHETEIVKIDSQGDLDLKKPLYEMGITGVFTKNLDIALLNGTIDIAVHSMKDVPTVLPENIVQAAVLKRAGSLDVCVFKDNEDFFHQKEAVIATGSLRRKAQWLHQYPTHTIEGLRGNVNTRMQKLEDSNWNGAIFAQAGLQRVKLLPKNHVKLDWMIPAPAQGIVMITALDSNPELLEVCKEINHFETEICAHIERQFLNTLEGGCTAPIGALAFFKEERLIFKGALFSLDGKKKIEVDKLGYMVDHKDLGKKCAEDILQRGGKKLMVEMASGPKAKKILSTKQLSENQTELFDDKFGIKMSDFIAIRYNRIKPTILKSIKEHLVITSQNGVEALLHNFSPMELDFKNIYCVGRRTKRLIEKKIGKVTAVENTAEELAKTIANNKEIESVTFLCGDKRRDDLIDVLSLNAIEVDEIEVYRTILNERKFNDTFDGVLFYSPTGVQSYIADNDNKSAVAFCIGETTAEEAKKHFDNVEVAKLPSIENVIKTVNEYYK